MSCDHRVLPPQSYPKENRWPAAILAVGVAIYLLWALVFGGITGLTQMALLLPVQIGIQVFLGLIACFLTARIMGIDFGRLTSAIVKLSAILVFPTAATFFIPWVGWLLALILYWKLIEWLFELEALETIVLSIVIWLVNIGALLLIATLGVAVRH